ncbi:MAG TPA: hypothetical protein PKN33_19980 [Phycisphaerae bacterium]|nr:hypothetical protein [Phycisphaerae bacterium]
MSVNCQHLAIAVGSRIAFEQMCRRERLIDEAMIKRTAAESLQAMTQLDIEAEYNHSDVPGATRVDLIGRTKPGVPLSLAAEVKWVKADGGTRDWQAELAEDALRLEILSQETTSATDRLLIICGISQTIDAQLINRKRHTGTGGSIAAMEHIVPLLTSGQDPPTPVAKIEVRSCDSGMRRLWKALSQHFGGFLPVSYKSSLAAHYRVDIRPQSIRVFIWRITRSQKRSPFSPQGTWQ